MDADDALLLNRINECGNYNLARSRIKVLFLYVWSFKFVYCGVVSGRRGKAGRGKVFSGQTTHTKVYQNPH